MPSFIACLRAQVAQAATVHLTPVTLELGGKDPAIILPETNIEKWASVWMRGVLYVVNMETRFHTSFMDWLLQSKRRTKLYWHRAIHRSRIAIRTPRPDTHYTDTKAATGVRLHNISHSRSRPDAQVARYFRHVAKAILHPSTAGP